MSLKPHFNIELQYLYNYGYGIYKKNNNKTNEWNKNQDLKRSDHIFFLNNCTNINEFMISGMNLKPHV